MATMPIELRPALLRDEVIAVMKNSCYFVMAH